MARERKKPEQDNKDQPAPVMETDDWIDADEGQAFEQALEKKGGPAKKQTGDKQESSTRP